MRHVQLDITLNEQLGLKAVAINYNDTGLPDNSELIQKVAFALLKCLHLNKGDIQVQDLLNEIGIERTVTP